MRDVRTSDALRPVSARVAALGNTPSDQVAAVCFRVRGHLIEFLLVRTRGGRWTFPKGRIEPGLTHAQTAALEAYEEAGVYGGVEEAAFARYVHRKRDRAAGRRELLVGAHLCHVLRLGKPKESGRFRTWFAAEKAKNCLREGRASACSDELIAVVDRAVARIERVHLAPPSPKDALQQVVFEKPASVRKENWMEHALLERLVFHSRGGDAAAAHLALDSRLNELLPSPRKNLLLMDGGRTTKGKR